MRIVDLHAYKGPHIYCGRRMPGRPGSPLGNPFKRGTPDPLGKYRAWLDAKIESSDPAVLAALGEITPASILGCWCADLKGEEVFITEEVCHCQIIAKIWLYWKKERRENVGNFDSVV